MNRLKDKRALITGGTSGIGLETARQFVQEGAWVAITGTNPKTIEAAGDELGENVLIIASDASDVPAQKMVAETMRQSFGGLDVLFLNAGTADLRPIEQWDEAGFDHSMALNVKGPYFLVQALLPCSRVASICDQRVCQCTYWHAEHDRVRSNERGSAVTDAHAIR
jgi:NAD(P)-dependent dehydrogenase (short-subunit alcohol dehydrogenase family)